MLNSGILELAIGLIFVYLILGLMCTSANEWISSLLKWRAKTLEEGIRLLLAGGFHRLRPADILDLSGLAVRLKGTDPLAEFLRSRLSATLVSELATFEPSAPPPKGLMDALLSDLNAVIDGACFYDKDRFSGVTLTRDTLRLAKGTPKGEDCARANRALLQEALAGLIGGPADQFYRHPLIKSLAPQGKRPSYVPSRTFALAVIDMVTSDRPEAADSAAALREQIDRLPDGDLKRSLAALMHEAGDSIVRSRHAIELWFNDSMDRVSGWYKRKTQWTTVILALIITVLTNADTLRIANTLWREPTVRAALVAQAQARVQEGAPSLEDRSAVQQLMGWTNELNTLGEKWNKDGVAGLTAWLQPTVSDHIIGWLLTAIATSLGAPFWFDMLNKVINLRSVGKSPEEMRPKAAVAAG